ncbi:cardiolipin synthase [Alicyclobacillus mengziensis]|uniref:Cardiolipin synthase n=1 Tax=Alicyclobacillus mengziensis TaxID=2931921 RepID=A0A9X7VWB9_9BACL|nr:cardiolipin synthase [Alicyclobacillus mengziensis]QSO46087.1 cardiolipin synthase [Alicyclobacillus mengziensis]
MALDHFITLFISFVTVINILLAAVILFVERRDVSSTWAWLIVLFFLPLIGFIVYIFLGRQLRRKNFYKLTEDERRYLEFAVNEQLEQLKNRRLQHEIEIFRKYADLMEMNLRTSNALISTDNEIQIFHDGKDKFTSLFRDIAQAKREINIEYYIIQPDSLAERLRDELTKKAREGVKVRVLFDQVGSRRMRRSFFQELISAGGEVEVFFPFFLKMVNLRLNNRNHRKLCVIDDEIAYIGGFNIGNEYLGLSKKFGYWRDNHLKLKGGAVHDIQGRFLLDWNQATNQNLVHFEDYAFHPNWESGNSVVQIVGSGPNSTTENIKNMYIKLIMSARKTVFIQTPYFIPDSSFMDACKIALLSGVDVRIMIPNKPDHPFVQWATWTYAGELLSYGAKVLLYNGGFLHAKTVIVDQEVASVGTTNIDIRSFRLNFEVNAVLYDNQMAERLQELFFRDSQACSELTRERYRDRSLGIRFKEAISRLLSPIL